MSMCVHITHVRKTDRVMCAYACVRACARGNECVCVDVNVHGVHVRVCQREEMTPCMSLCADRSV